MLATDFPFGQCFDLAGKPLTGGAVYYGLAGQNPINNPIVVYWDADGDREAAQPIQTLNGYPVRSGTPTLVFANVAYSMLILDAAGRTVFYLEDSSDLPSSIGVRLANPAEDETGMGMVAYDPRRNYPQQTGGAWMNESISVRALVGLGLTSAEAVDAALDLAASRVSANGAASIHFAELPGGDPYEITDNLSTDEQITLRFSPGAKLQPASGKTITINGPVEAGAAQIFDFSAGGSVSFRSQSVMRPEWWGILSDNTAADNTANWAKYLAQVDDTTSWHFLFGKTGYPWVAPFMLPQRTKVEMEGGAESFGGRIALAGSDEHAVEFVYVNAGAVTRDTAMAQNCQYARMYGMNFDASAMTFTGGKRRSVCYMVGASSCFVEKCRFTSPADATNQMDGICMVPSRATAAGAFHQACIRNKVSDSRISNTRNAGTLGRGDGAWSESEPCNGGDGDLIGGDTYENEIINNVFLPSTTLKAYPNHGWKLNYYDYTASALPGARPKPYANTLAENSVIMGYSTQITGTIAINSGGPTAVVGTGTLFTSELPTPSSTHLVGLRFTGADGVQRLLRVASVTNDTNLVLTDSYSGATMSGKTAILHTGVALDNQSIGDGNDIHDNYTDYGVYSGRQGSNASASTMMTNRPSGAPRESVNVNAARNSGVLVTRHDTSNLESAQKAEVIYRGMITCDALRICGDSTSTSKTIASGTITIVSTDIVIDTEGAAASDDLDTITFTNVEHGTVIALCAANDARTVVIKHNTGNILCGADVSLDNSADQILLKWWAPSTKWRMISFANNGA